MNADARPAGGGRLAAGGYLLAGVLVVLAVAEVYRTLHDGRANIEAFFNDDTLYAASVYEDLFVDGFSARGWQLPAATFWFPDQALYFVCRTLTGAVSKAT